MMHEQLKHDIVGSGWRLNKDGTLIWRIEREAFSDESKEDALKCKCGKIVRNDTIALLNHLCVYHGFNIENANYIKRIQATIKIDRERRLKHSDI